MTIKKLESIVTETFRNLEVDYLNSLDETASFSNLDKEGIIDDLKFKIDLLLSNHSPPLSIQPGKCIFCYPEGKAIRFMNPQTGHMAIQIVILQEGKKEFRIEECRNKPLPENDDGLPF